jgi:hypothetical protein
LLELAGITGDIGQINFIGGIALGCLLKLERITDDIWQLDFIWTLKLNDCSSLKGSPKTLGKLTLIVH